MNNNLLLVDDEEGILSALTRLLRKEKYNIFRANNGADAVEILSKENIGVIVCDQKMPNMSGAEVLKKAYKITPQTVRITLTAYAEVDILLKTVNEGKISQLLIKPWDDENIKNVIREAFGQYNLYEENKRLEDLSKEQFNKLEKLNNELEEKVQERTEHLHNTQKKLEKSLKDIIVVLSKMMEEYSPSLQGHSKRVAIYAKELAQVANLSDKEILDIEGAGYLHDLGFISTPVELLKKDLKQLTQREDNILKKHPELGFELLRNVSNFDKIASIVLHHHETIDGLGYPNKLKNDEINIGSKIIAIANMYDRIRYSQSDISILNKDAAIEKLINLGKNKLDAELLKLFVLQVLSDDTSELETEIELPLEMIKDNMKLSRNFEKNGILIIKKGIVFDAHSISQLLQREDLDPAFDKVFLEREVKIEKVKKQVEIEPKKPTQKRILILDDEENILNSLKRELVRHKYKVSSFTNYKQALNELTTTKIDAIITDYNMPNIKGDEFLKLAYSRKPNVPAIVITGYATKLTVIKLMQSENMVKILSKPWSHDELINTLSEVISNKTTQV